MPEDAVVGKRPAASPPPAGRGEEQRLPRVDVPVMKEVPRAAAGNGETKPVQLAAAKPDAAPKKAHHVLRAFAHAVILLSVVTFVFYYCVYLPLIGATKPYQLARVTTVANPLTDVRSPPGVTGVFVAATALPIGAQVSKGQVLGRILAPALDAEIDKQTDNLTRMQQQHLSIQLQKRALVGASVWQAEQEERDLALKVATAEKELSQLRAKRRQLVIRAPADGRLQFGLSGTKAVKEYDSVVTMYPEGADLLVEVTGPLDVINNIERQDRIVAQFQMKNGTVEVQAMPIASSVRSFTKVIQGGAKEETWGSVQCKPVSMPESIRLPGMIGTLR
jgi:hypothetical protein